MSTTTPAATAAKFEDSNAADSSALHRAGQWLFRGRSDTAVWERPAQLGLLLVTALLYLVNLSASGWANSFYSAAVQAGSSNWEAFLFGSSDAANSITVDKPPASLWLMDLSVRLFGLSSFSILLPEAIMGIVTVAVLHTMVRRHFSPGAALFAGGALAVTPVAALMFRFNNPDALLLLLTTLAVYFTLRGIESAKMRWVMWAGAMIGLAFLTKQLQAFLILPVLVGVYLSVSPVRLGKRFVHLLAALATLVLSAGWWVALIELLPASLRPYVGGSQTNSFLELTFGYNGLGRLSGNETGSVGGGGTGTTGNWGATGILRLFEGEIGGQVTWLLPAALIVMVTGFVLTRRLPRTSPKRALLALMSGWLLITAVFFSFMAGIFHAYYTIALAAPLAGVVAIGGGLLWAERNQLWARIILASTVLFTVFWAYSLLSLASSWQPWVKWMSLALGLIAAALVLLPPAQFGHSNFAVGRLALGHRLRAGVPLVVTLVGVLLAPTAYTIQTVSTAHTGSIVSAGPTVAGGGFGAGRGGFGGATRPPGAAGTTPGAARRGGPGGGMGGLLGGGTVSSTVVTVLAKNAGAYTWMAAAIGSNNAAGYQLEAQFPVMALGGFNGSDPSPTLQQFKDDVAAGKIHYFIGTSTIGRSSGGSSASAAIAAWVASTFTATTVDGVTLYDLAP